MKKIPCRQCITFPICKSLYHETLERTALTPKDISARGTLYTKCGLMRVWVEAAFAMSFKGKEEYFKELHEFYTQQ